MTVPAISAHIPFTGGGNLVYFHPSPTERYFPVGPGIEVSIEPYEKPQKEEETSQNSSVYDGLGRLSGRQKKGFLIDVLM